MNRTDKVISILVAAAMLCIAGFLVAANVAWPIPVDRVLSGMQFRPGYPGSAERVTVSIRGEYRCYLSRNKFNTFDGYVALDTYAFTEDQPLRQELVYYGSFPFSDQLDYIVRTEDGLLSISLGRMYSAPLSREVLMQLYFDSDRRPRDDLFFVAPAEDYTEAQSLYQSLAEELGVVRVVRAE